MIVDEIDVAGVAVGKAEDDPPVGADRHGPHSLPLTAQTMTYWGIEAPFGLTPIAFGLIFGGAWGLYANIKGRWI